MKSRFLQCLVLAYSLLVTQNAIAGDADINFAGDDAGASVISGDVSVSDTKDKLEFRGDDADQADAMFNSIVSAIETQSQFNGSASVPAQMVVKTDKGTEEWDITFSTVIFNEALYLITELPTGEVMVWTVTK